MFDPSSITLGQASSILRDLSIVIATFVLVWRLRGAYEAVSAFITRTSQHMESMEAFAKVVIENHLKHIEADLKTLSGRKSDNV